MKVVHGVVHEVVWTGTRTIVGKTRVTLVVEVKEFLIVEIPYLFEAVLARIDHNLESLTTDKV